MDKSSAARKQLDLHGYRPIKLISVSTFHGVIVLIPSFFFFVIRIPLQNFSKAVCFFSLIRIEFCNWNDILLPFLDKNGRDRSLALMICWTLSTGKDFDFFGFNEGYLFNIETIIEWDLNFNFSDGISMLF